MQVGVIGSGTVGRVLASAFLKENYQVMLGTRDVSKDDVMNWKTECAGGLTGSFEEMAKSGEILVLATGGSGIRQGH